MAGAKLSAVPSDNLCFILNPKSHIHSQFSDTQHPNVLNLTTNMASIIRGPRYKAYADLRESKLRLKSLTNPLQLPRKDHTNINISTPPKIQNQVKFSTNRRKVFSVLTQSVPDFSPVLRKENRKPALPPVAEKSATPPAKNSSRLYEVNAKLMGSKSMVSREKRGDGMLAARRSCANMDELKKFSMAAANAINGEGRRVRVAGNRVGGRSTVLGSRQCY